MDTSPSPPIDLASLTRSADTYHELARRLEAEGQAEAAEFAYAAAAALDLRNPELQASFGGPFNGQEERCRVVRDLLAALKPAATVETGTFRGTTTEWLAIHFDGPIYSSELDRRYFLQAREKLARFATVRVSLADLRVFLRDLLPGIPKDRPVLFYLDAHWNEDLPLAEEVRLIVEQAPLAVIMIDDFRVPFDPGYSWDDYGPGKRLSLELLYELKDRCSFAFPSLPATEETGARRGLCVLTAAGSLRDVIAMQPRLRQAEWREWRVVEAEAAAEDAARATQRLHEELRSGRTKTQRLHEELRSGRTATLELQQALRLAEERAEHAAAQVAELQYSRWRRIGLLLGLARKATFER